MLINVHIRSFTIKIFPKIVSLQKFLKNIKTPLISNAKRDYSKFYELRSKMLYHQTFSSSLFYCPLVIFLHTILGYILIRY